MLETFTTETFSGLVGETFEAVPAEGESLSLVLDECAATPYGSPEVWRQALSRVPFALRFHAADGRLVPQQTCALRHPELGEFPLFVVPLGAGQDGMRYEAIIS